MSLSKQDLSDIRDVVLDALDVAVNPRLDSLESKVDSLENRMDSMEGRMAAQESAQHETNRRLGAIESQLDSMDGRLEALEADVKELYAMVGGHATGGKSFGRQTPERKLRLLYAEVTALARELHVEL